MSAKSPKLKVAKTFIIILHLLLFSSFDGYATKGGEKYPFVAQTNILAAEKQVPPSIEKPAAEGNVTKAKNIYAFKELNATAKEPKNPLDPQSVIWLLIQSIFAGLLAVFTPYMYTIHPFTTGYLARKTKSAGEKLRNTLIYAMLLIAIFAFLGLLVSLIIKFTGVQKFTDHWIFNFYLCRTYIVLGIAFFGGFAMKLPAVLINAMAKQAKSNNLKGIFFMAGTLPVTSFSSTFPIIALVLLIACNGSFLGPIIGLFGFGAGLAAPFVFPGLLNIFVKSKSALNNIKVIMGFLSLMIALKFMSKTDISLGLNLIGRDLFIEIWMIMFAFMGVYMLGMIKFPDDTEPEQNVFGQEYIPLSRLFIAITSFVFALYLLPGIWGAPLRGISGFLPQ